MYQGRTLKVLNALPALIAMAMLAVCKVASASGTSANLIFSYPTGFAGAGNAIRTAASAQISGSVIELTTGTAGDHEAGAAWYMAQQNIQAFTTDFTFQLNPSGYGITFCVQNSNSTTNPPASGIVASADTNLLGYGAYALAGQYAIRNSIAVKFDLSGNGQRNYVTTPNATGLYINGGPAGTLLPAIDLNPSGVNLHSGDIMAGHIVYDGSILTMTLRDTVTNAQFRTSWPINIPSITGSNSAWVGFTGGTIPAVAQNLLTWSFSEGYNTRLATPTFGVAAGQYTSAQSVSISGPAGATIYYTTNGQQPTSSSSVYTGPISVGASEIIQAVAIQSGYTDSYVAVGNYQIASSSTPLINFPSGLTGAMGLVNLVGYAKLSGSSIRLTDTNSAGLEAGAAWYAVPVNVQSFTTSFTLQFTSANANGMTFCIQNQPPASSDRSILYVSGGPNAIANSQSGLGYSGSTGGVGGQIAGLLNSVAVKFDLTSNTTGIYTNGANPTTPDVTIAGVNLNSGNPLAVTLAYNGTTLTMTITDTKTKASFSSSWAINIPTTVGGNTAYVGFTAATGFQFANQDVLSWTYSASPGQTPAIPAAPTNLRVQ